ncbi:MAG: hypothetical protein KDD70_09360 [Bdellovibrionales bacterium]|nr:hypothetical protein [Bdellovibrionales bacterium]
MANEVLDCVISKDPTWHFAYHYVRKHFDVPSHIYRLLKAGWMGEAQPMDYVKILGFSRLNPSCLIQAAELSGAEMVKGRGAVERAITFLGTRFSSVVLGIHLYTSLFLRKKPPLGWRSFLEEMINTVELGYRFGAHASLLGTEAGALIGFASHSGLGILMATDKERYKEYMSLRRTKPKIAPKDEIECFGCELYQLSTLVLQQLGYGMDFAMGVALASGRLDDFELNVGKQAYVYEAAAKWIVALKDGKNYPADLKHRQMFGELKPPGPGVDRNQRLEVLYTEVGKLKAHPSQWVWHLPKPDYDLTRDMFRLQ